MVRFFSAAFLVFLSAFAAAQEGNIPLLISEHHADHMEFFLRRAAGAPAAMIVLDAHADTAVNENSALFRGFAAAGNFSAAGRLAGNHNWIQPLCPFPLETVVWAGVMRGSPRGDKLKGFYKSAAAWKNGARTLAVSVDELRFHDAAFPRGGETLFVSVDLDFFYNEDCGPEDVGAVLDALFCFAARRPGRVVWAVALSRPWLPDDSCAWELLQRCLEWLRSRPEFAAPRVSLFDGRRDDTSRKAEAFRAEGREMPALREEDAPQQIKALIQELLARRSLDTDTGR